MEIKLSIVVPCYNEEAVLHDFYREITKVLTEDMKQVKYEIIFVDDGSKDTTVEIIEDLSNRDEFSGFHVRTRRIVHRRRRNLFRFGWSRHCIAWRKCD